MRVELCNNRALISEDVFSTKPDFVLNPGLYQYVLNKMHC